MVRGDTYHFDVVSDTSAAGLMQLSLTTDAVITNGILTVNNQGQALARSANNDHNKRAERGIYYELFVIIDIYSRYVVAWTVAEAETGELAEAFIEAALDRQQITKGQLTLHADRGSSMTSKPVAQLLVDLGVARSHSRPSVSNDNPYSEAHFKTLKYCPAFPARFGSIADARVFSEAFFDHYNHVHRHCGIALHTPASVHYGTATEIRTQRAATLDAAYAANPARFRHRPPTPPKLPSVAWINEPTQEALIRSA